MLDWKNIVAGVLVAAVVGTVAAVIDQGKSVAALQVKIERGEVGSSSKVGISPTPEDVAIQLVANQSFTSLLGASIPVGVIVMWAGNPNDIPKDWALCDGTSGTPDLRGRFILASGTAVPEQEKTGGGQFVLQEANIPSHNHTINHTHGHKLSVSPESHNHAYSRTRTDIVGNNYEGASLEAGNARGLWTGDSVTTGSTDLKIAGGITEYQGKSGEAGRHPPVPIDVIPKYYQLAFIMKRR